MNQKKTKKIKMNKNNLKNKYNPTPSKLKNQVKKIMN